jgi:hypothetical protein
MRQERKMEGATISGVERKAANANVDQGEGRDTVEGRIRRNGWSCAGGAIDRAGKGGRSLVRTDYARNDN